METLCRTGIAPALPDRDRNGRSAICSSWRETRSLSRTARSAFRIEHSEAWLNALNQARLALAAKFDFTEAELCDHYRSPIGSRRDLSLFQVNFYGFLQEFILREMECDGAPGPS